MPQNNQKPALNKPDEQPGQDESGKTDAPQSERGLEHSQVDEEEKQQRDNQSER